MSTILNKQTVSDNNPDVILPTPEKKPKKKLRLDKSKLQRGCHYSPGPDIIPHTAVEEVHIERRTHDITPHNQPLTGSDMRSFIFHNHEEFLSYTNNVLPKHNTIKMVGIFKHNVYRYFLKKYSPCTNHPEIYVILNVKNLLSLPDFGEHIEVYGHLEFDTFNDKNLPVLNVRILTKISGSIEEYLMCMEVQKLFIPSNCKEKVWNDFEDTTFIAADEISLLFNEHDEETSPQKKQLLKYDTAADFLASTEFMLRKKLPCLESNQQVKLCKDIDEVVNINLKGEKLYMQEQSLIDIQRESNCIPTTTPKAPVKQPTNQGNKPSTSGVLPGRNNQPSTTEVLTGRNNRPSTSGVVPLKNSQQKGPNIKKAEHQKSSKSVSHGTVFHSHKKGDQVEVGSGESMDDLVDISAVLDFMKDIANTDFDI